MHVIWDADKNKSDEVAQAEILTGGLLKVAGAEIVVRAGDGHVVPSRLLQVGPGDQARVVFALRPGQRDYVIYFGNPSVHPAPASQPALVQRGLLMEMNQWLGQPINSSEQIARAWLISQRQPIGKILVDRPFIGVNPLGDEDRTIAKLSGTFFAPVDGEYQFAATADDRGALYIDGQSVVYAPYAVGDIRFNKTLTLKRGEHDFIFYEVNTGGEIRFTVGWKRPDTATVIPMPAAAFGVVRTATPGDLELADKPLVADFSFQVKSEIFYANDYAYRVVLTANPPPGNNITYDWDLGDGTTATGPQVEHVYLHGGQFPVKLTTSAYGKTDTRTNIIWVRRDWQRAANPPSEFPKDIAQLVAGYSLDKLDTESLRLAVLLQMVVNHRGAALEAAGALASRDRHPNPSASMDALKQVTLNYIDAGAKDAVQLIWGKVPATSNIRPAAMTEYASQLLWHLGNPDAALKVLEPVKKSSIAASQLHAQVLLLDGKAAEAEAELKALPVHGDPEKRVAMSGALARSVEYFISDDDAESADEEWNRWQLFFPMDFLDGYSLLLKVQIMQLRQANEAAANIALAFVTAEPQSSYAPSLLDTAARGLQTENPDRAKQFRQLLKEKYPEDPRAQAPADHP